jgi:hypothetical protein
MTDPNSEDESARGASLSDSDESVPPVAKKKRRSYSIKFQLEAVDYAKANSKNGASKRFKVDRKTIQEWSKKEDRLRELL